MHANNMCVYINVCVTGTNHAQAHIQTNRMPKNEYQTKFTITLTSK